MKILVVSHEFPPIGGGGANAYLSTNPAKIINWTSYEPQTKNKSLTTGNYR